MNANIAAIAENHFIAFFWIRLHSYENTPTECEKISFFINERKFAFNDHLTPLQTSQITFSSYSMPRNSSVLSKVCILAHDWRSSSSMVCSNVNSEILDEPAKDVQNKLPPEKKCCLFVHWKYQSRSAEHSHGLTTLNPHRPCHKHMLVVIVLEQKSIDGYQANRNHHALLVRICFSDFKQQNY